MSGSIKPPLPLPEERAGEVDQLMNPLMSMFMNQIRLQKLACDIDVPTDDPNMFYLHATACMVELSEAIQSDNRWKHMLGGKRPERVAPLEKLDELVDAMHFLLNAVLYSGFSYTQFVKAFFEKGKVNIERQSGQQ